MRHYIQYIGLRHCSCDIIATGKNRRVKLRYFVRNNANADCVGYIGLTYIHSALYTASDANPSATRPVLVGSIHHNN